MKTELNTPTIVVGVDCSPGSAKALHWAAEQASLTHARLHIIESMQYLDWVPSGYLPADGASLRRESVVDVRERLEQFVDEATSGMEPVDAELTVVNDSPAHALLATAEADDADLIVVGSRGRGGFKSLLLGSVGEQVVTHAHCPVVVIRPES